jgi:hypothetical protein
MHFLSSLKSGVVQTVLSFLGMLNVGNAHHKDSCHTNTPMLHNRLIFFMRTALCLCGIGLGLPWYDFIPSFNLKGTDGSFQSPNVPSKSDLNLCSTESSFSLSDAYR